MTCPECGRQIVDERYPDFESIKAANVDYWCPHCKTKLDHHLVVTCWECPRVGQANTMDSRDLVCRAYGELRVICRVGEAIGIPEWCPKGMSGYLS